MGKTKAHLFDGMVVHTDGRHELFEYPDGHAELHHRKREGGVSTFRMHRWAVPEEEVRRHGSS